VSDFGSGSRTASLGKFRLIIVEVLTAARFGVASIVLVVRSWIFIVLLSVVVEPRLKERYLEAAASTMLQTMQLRRLNSTTEETAKLGKTVIEVHYRRTQSGYRSR